MKENKKPVSTCFGITNKTSDGQYVLFADYDDVNFSVVIKDLDNLIKRFPNEFCNFIILESSESKFTSLGTFGSYHVINFIKRPYQKMREYLSYLAVDDDFFKLPTKTSYRCNTLRVSPKFDFETQNIIKDKPRFICLYPSDELISPKKDSLISSAHLKFYQKSCPHNLFKLFNVHYKKIEDNLSKIQLKKYNSLRG